MSEPSENFQVLVGSTSAAAMRSCPAIGQYDRERHHKELPAEPARRCAAIPARRSASARAYRIRLQDAVRAAPSHQPAGWQDPSPAAPTSEFPGWSACPNAVARQPWRHRCEQRAANAGDGIVLPHPLRNLAACFTRSPCGPCRRVPCAPGLALAVTGRFNRTVNGMLRRAARQGPMNHALPIGLPTRARGRTTDARQARH